ncbi:MAG: glutaredoxin family protein [Acidobacteria bacterium]|nr:glutaredoxin family protein [Acidobacteriota bacterium]
MKNKLFTMRDCPHCRDAKEFLDRCAPVYVEYDITDDPEALRLMLTLTGRAEVPTLVAGYEAVVGFNVETWNRVVEHGEAIRKDDPFRLPESIGPDPHDDD